jgi:hypothetical protein
LRRFHVFPGVLSAKIRLAFAKKNLAAIGGWVKVKNHCPPAVAAAGSGKGED